MPDKKRIRVVLPTDWDFKQLPACRERWEDGYEVDFAKPSDHDCPWDFDVLAYITSECEERAERGYDGVFSSSDYPGATIAAAIATRLGLAGSDPRAVIGASHKYYSRIAQREAAPEASAWFALVDSTGPVGDEPLRFPCFIKPVKGAFSIMSERLDDERDFEAFLGRRTIDEFLSDYVYMFNRLVAELTSLEINGSYFLAEELLKGKQVTLEGFVTDSTLGRLGIVDSVRHPRTKSFVRFDYPTSLPRRVQERMWDIADRVVKRLGLRQTLFNIELMYDSRRDRISIVEVNPRMCGQFADLYEKVDAINGYEIALALAAGESPVVTPGEGEFDVAASYPLRIFEPSRVSSAPSEEKIEEAARLYSQTLVWSECGSGDSLEDFESSEDGKSARYAIVNLGARDREELHARLAEVTRVLDYRFEQASTRQS